MKDSDKVREGFYGWLANTVERHSVWLIVGTVVITLLLLWPLFQMQPTEIASDNPLGSDVVRWHEEAKDKFPYEVYPMLFIVEARDGDMLTQRNLYELLQNQQALRAGNLSPFLYKRYSQAAGITVQGIYSIADAVNSVLILGSGGVLDLSSATDMEVKQAVDIVLKQPSTRGMEGALSVKASYQETLGGAGLWKSPALTLFVESDREKVTQEYPISVGQEYSVELALEHFGREVQEILRGQQEGYQLWGVALDLNLEIADEGQQSGPMLAAAIIIILILVSLIFRSLVITLLCGVGLGMVLIWLHGFSNLAGLKSSIILDLIVPIAILVLGIDYAIHAIFRYREEKEKGNPPLKSLGSSTYRVGSALVLAMLTTVIAFSANASAGIESLVGFAVAASAAIFASFLILGFFVPAAVMWYETWRGRHVSLAAAGGTTSPPRSIMGSLVAWFSNRWFVTLPLIVLVTLVAIVGWLNLETKLDPEDALDSKSDLVIGLDKLDEHIAQKAGEPAFLYIKGDFTQPGALRAMKAVVSEMEDDEHVARRLSDGKPDARLFLFEYLAAVLGSDYALERIEAAFGLTITDSDGDLIPDTPAQLLSVYDYIVGKGIPLNENSLLYSPQRIGESFYHDSSGKEEDATLIFIGVPGTREQSIVKASAIELNDDMEKAMSGVSGITFYGITGEAYVRDVQFSAITDSLSRSLVIAVAACLLLLVAVFRSLRYAIVTLIPVVLVACWLYGFMYVMGFHLNLMTATIAAISIGVGIDFSIHFTVRFRQELAGSFDKRTALYSTARSTGVALFGTALSTASGFAVIAFAPMPMFAAFGVLTAVMIVLSFLMALFALPSLLLLFAPAVALKKP